MKKIKKFFIKKIYPDPQNLKERIERMENIIDRYIIAKEIEKHSRPETIIEENKLDPIMRIIKREKYKNN